MSAFANQKELEQIRREQKFKVIAAVLMLLFAAMLLSACGNSPLNENKLAQIIPEDILKYSLDGTTNIMTVKNLTIDKRQTNENEDIVYAIIDMEDSYVHRTAYYMFNISHWNKTGWIIEKWEKYQNTTSYPVSCPAENMANDVISKKRYEGYTLKSVNTNDLKNGKCAYIFDISDVKRYAATSGQAEVVFSLNSGDYLHWSSSLDTSGLTTKWDIAGKWTAATFTIGWNNTMEASANIIKVTDTAFRLNGISIIHKRGSTTMRYQITSDKLTYDNKNQQFLSNYFDLFNSGGSGQLIFNANEARLEYGNYSTALSRTGN